ncbi:hypothetical protein OROMI_028619 [Orobanche minor]
MLLGRKAKESLTSTQRAWGGNRDPQIVEGSRHAFEINEISGMRSKL